MGKTYNFQKLTLGDKKDVGANKPSLNNAFFENDLSILHIQVVMVLERAVL